MGILSEQERPLTNEQNFINEDTQHGYTNTAWGTIHDYGNITTSLEGIVVFKLDMKATTGGDGYVRVKIGSSLYVINIKDNTGVFRTFGGAVWIAAGTFDILVEAKAFSASDPVYIKNMQVGFMQLNDCAHSHLTQYTTEPTSLSLTVTARNTPLGALNEAVYAVQVYATNGVLINTTCLQNGLAVYVDNIRQDWDELSDGTCHVATSGKLYFPCTVGTSHTIKFDCPNGGGPITFNCSIIACPWILTMPNRVHNPITLNFPQFSTVYMILGVMWNDVTKTAYVGKKHAISLGYGDYYGSSSGAGLLTFSFTFESVNVGSVTFIVDGMGGCIEIIAVDLR